MDLINQPSNGDQVVLVDTHCHIHDTEFEERFQGMSPDQMIQAARNVGVSKFICVGTDEESSKQSVAFCSQYAECFASVALHPHEAEKMNYTELEAAMTRLGDLARTERKGIVAIGECGLDYFYHNDPKTHEKQEFLLRKHLLLARELDLPVIFHVRDAFEQFFKILDDFQDIRGVVHSFTSNSDTMREVLKRGLYIGLNGIMTFTRDELQLRAAKEAPLDKIVVETDAPFLTPAPFRGTMCQPKHVVVTAEFLSDLRGETMDHFALQTTLNAQQLFGL